MLLCYYSATFTDTKLKISVEEAENLYVTYIIVNNLSFKC